MDWISVNYVKFLQLLVYKMIFRQSHKNPRSEVIWWKLKQQEIAEVSELKDVACGWKFKNRYGAPWLIPPMKGLSTLRFTCIFRAFSFQMPLVGRWWWWWWWWIEWKMKWMKDEKKCWRNHGVRDGETGKCVIGGEMRAGAVIRGSGVGGRGIRSRRKRPKGEGWEKGECRTGVYVHVKRGG